MFKKYLIAVAFLLSSSYVFSQQKTNEKSDSSFKITTTFESRYTAMVYFQITYYQVQSATFSADSLQKIFSFVESKKKELGNNILVTYEYIKFKDNKGRQINLDVVPYNSRKSIITETKENR